jgi:sterol 14-demethylase
MFRQCFRQLKAVALHHSTNNCVIMDMTNGIVWFTIALVFITVVISKATRGVIKLDPKCNPPHPPTVKGVSFIRVLHTLLSKGLQAMIHDQYTKLGSVFTISFFQFKVTFLIGPEVSAHFYQGLDSEISHGNAIEFTVPMLGKEVGYGVDTATRNEQARIAFDALKPSKLRSHAAPMIQELGVSEILTMSKLSCLIK